MEMFRPLSVILQYLVGQYEHWLDISWQDDMNYEFKWSMLVGVRQMGHSISVIVGIFAISQFMLSHVYKEHPLQRVQ